MLITCYTRKFTFKIRIYDGFLSYFVQVQSGAKELQTALDHKNKDIVQCKAQLEYQCLGRKFIHCPLSSARPSWSISA
jgi:hypothetical protein